MSGEEIGGAIPVTKRVMEEALLPDIVLTVPLLVEAPRRRQLR